MKRVKFLFAFVLTFISIFVLSTNTFAAESSIEKKIKSEIETYVNEGKLSSWYMSLSDDEGFQNYYYKEVYLNDNFEEFSNLSYQEAVKYCTWYQSNINQTWDYVLKNLDIEAKYLEPNSILGVYWDSCFNKDVNEGYLYVIWVSKYTPSEHVTITQLTESGTVYPLYENIEDIDTKNSNFLPSSYYHYKEDDITIHLTAVAGYTKGKQFGLPLKQVYTFENIMYGIDPAYTKVGNNYTNELMGSITSEVKFDLKLIPKQDGNNSMLMTNHGYTIIEDIEAQSYFDANFGGYIHKVYFNLSIAVDKVYRVDCSYKLTNSDKKWWEVLLPSDEHQMVKSLTTERVSGGLFGLTKYQGLTEGKFASTIDGTTTYKYALHVNYDASWAIFKGKDINEGAYKRISNFEILRMNFLVDGETYDIPISMDTIESETLNPISPDVILDTNSKYYEVKDWLDDSVDKVKDSFSTLKDKANEYKNYIYAGAAVVASVAIIWFLFKVYRWFKMLFIFIPDDNNNERK